MARFKKHVIQEAAGDKILNWITGAVLVGLLLIVGYPLIYVISCAFSSSSALESGLVTFLPVDFSLEAFEFVFQYKQVWVGFRNSVFYCFCSTVISLACTILVAFPLSRPNFWGKNFYTTYFFVSSRIGAGMIPVFIMVCNLGMYDTFIPSILLGCVSFRFIIILRTAFKSNIPGDLYDAAYIDGASHFSVMMKIAVPLAKATLSVLILYQLVEQWNEYFTAMLYMRNENLYPLQLVLRPIMTAASTMGTMNVSGMSSAYQTQASSGLENVRYALIIISSVPPILAYFVVQKAFKGGVMIGSVKG